MARHSVEPRALTLAFYHTHKAQHYRLVSYAYRLPLRPRIPHDFAPESAPRVLPVNAKLDLDAVHVIRCRLLRHVCEQRDLLVALVGAEKLQHPAFALRQAYAGHSNRSWSTLMRARARSA